MSPHQHDQWHTWRFDDENRHPRAHHKIQLPAEWVEQLGLHGFAELEKGPDGIVVRRCSHLTWDDVFADKLTIGSDTTTPESGGVNGDDYLF